MTRYLIAAGFVVGASVAFLLVEVYESIKACRQFAKAQAMADLLEEMGEPRLTVLWQTKNCVQRGMTGRVEWVTDDVLMIEDGDEFAYVNRIDILEMR